MFRTVLKSSNAPCIEAKCKRSPQRQALLTNQVLNPKNKVRDKVTLALPSTRTCGVPTRSPARDFGAFLAAGSLSFRFTKAASASRCGHGTVAGFQRNIRFSAMFGHVDLSPCRGRASSNFTSHRRAGWSAKRPMNSNCASSKSAKRRQAPTRGSTQPVICKNRQPSALARGLNRQEGAPEISADQFSEECLQVPPILRKVAEKMPLFNG